MFLVATVLICSTSLVLSSTVRSTTITITTTPPRVTTTTPPNTSTGIYTTTGAIETCKDRISNCVSYGSKICTGTYQEWAEINCKDFCGLCVDTVLIPTPGPLAPSPGTCADEIGNCQQYEKTICNGPYHVWAKQHCADFCGFCTLTTISTKSHVVYTNAVTRPTSQTNGMCKDYSTLCAKYNSTGDICHEPYVAWAQTNCPAYCGYCTGTLQYVTKPVVNTYCTDKIPNCHNYGKYACQGSYTEWAKHNCAGYCGFCTAQQQVTKPVINANCMDKLTNCHDYGKDACQGPYTDWAKHNCAGYCGFCSGQVQSVSSCFDKITNCNQFTSKACTQYPDWARRNCVKFCGLCDPAIVSNNIIG